MDHWEYRYVDLYRTSVADGFKELILGVSQAGIEGWEAVGQINVTVPGANIPTLLLKRRLQMEARPPTLS
jgi:hypothetical protein